MNRPLTPTLLALLLLAGLAVPATAQEDDEVAQRSEEFVYILDQGESGRVEIEMRQGGGLNWVISSGQRPIEFHMFSENETGQIQDHIGPERIRSDSGTFAAPADGIYVFNTTRALELQATVRLNLNGEFRVDELHGIDPATEVPAPPVLVVLAVLACAALVLNRRRRAGNP